MIPTDKVNTSPDGYNSQLQKATYKLISKISNNNPFKTLGERFAYFGLPEADILISDVGLRVHRSGNYIIEANLKFRINPTYESHLIKYITYIILIIFTEVVFHYL